ncbi:winged helix-turn-helix transcriptional regulator [Rhodococcus sp. 27YEA15]|uniref:winged helix-turn-helix transcriptional regulator n=1 Tax=Rhodococcus sp. 27YEA15 TaxID=3156259 RepID=UPI003C7AF554
MTRVRRSWRSPRHEYLPTQRGRDLRPVLGALYVWGNRQLGERDESVVLVNEHTGDEIDPVVVDRRTG